MRAGSYDRLDAIIDAMEGLGYGPDWFRLLGREWSCCDNIWRWRTFLRQLLSRATRDQLDMMMTDEERTALAAMPERLTIFRGCYRINRAGLSWTLDRPLAERFPRFMRYWRPGDQALLLTANVLRSRAVLKLDREETEIIPAVRRMRPTKVELLSLEVPS